MSTDHEKLITEAAKVIDPTAWLPGHEFSRLFSGFPASQKQRQEAAENLASLVFAVFEKARTPTDEALVDMTAEKEKWRKRCADETNAWADATKRAETAEQRWRAAEDECRAVQSRLDAALAMSEVTERCTYCGEEFPKPVSLHHAESECVHSEPTADVLSAAAELRRIVDIDDARRVLVSSADVRVVLDSLQARTVQGEPIAEQVGALRKLVERAHEALKLPRGRLETTKKLAGMALPLTVGLDLMLRSGVVSVQDEPTSEDRACSWAEYRKDYQPQRKHLGREAVAFTAGWDAAIDIMRHGSWVPVVDLPEGEEQ